jgi:UDP-N-acetyl-2-amino-2-deoxyglucuronate dehydrogenase
MTAAIETETGTALTVAIVGCGIIGVNHAKVIARQPDLIVTAVVDVDPVAADALAELVSSELGFARPASYQSLEAALAEQSFGLVAICTPSGLHVELAEEAIASGAHVVLEKPLDVSVARGRRLAELAEAAEARGQLVSVISQHRFDPASVVVAHAVHNGSFGRMTSAVASVAWWRSQDYYDSGDWRGTLDLDGGGSVMNQGVHTVDLLVWFLGTPVAVFAHTALLAHEGIEVEDIAVATLRFESGALAVLHATTSAYPGLSVRLQLHGTLGSAIIDDDQLEYFFAADPADPDRSGKGARNQAESLVPSSELRGGDKGHDGMITGHLRQYDDVVAAIRTGRPPGVRVVDALLSLAVVRAVYLSAGLGREISLDEVLSGALDETVLATAAVAEASA